MAVRAVAMSQTCMEVGWCVARFAGIGVVGKAQDGGRGSGNDTYTFYVTAQAVGIHIRIMKVCQITLVRTTEGMAGRTV